MSSVSKIIDIINKKEYISITMSSLHTKLSDYAKLARIQTAPIVAYVPLVGALASGRCDIVSIGILFTIGFLSHIYIFVSNEYIDLEIDKYSKALVKKPMIESNLPKIQALLIAAVALTIAIVLTILFFPKPTPFLLFIISIGFATIYNIYGKRIPGFEITVGVWAFTFCLFACVAIGGKITGLVYLLSILFLIQMWIACAVDGSIKDADHDYNAGVKTVATVLGVRTEGDRLIIPTLFKLFCLATSGTYVVIALLFYSFWVVESLMNLQLLFVFSFGLVMLYAQFKMITFDVFDRPNILKYVLIHQFPTVIIPLALLVSKIGIFGSLMVGIFIFTLATLIILGLYGKSYPTV